MRPRHPDRRRGLIHIERALGQEEGDAEKSEAARGGAITQNNKLVEASGVQGYFDSEEEAQQAGFAWARAWVDSHF
ncbi:hypothetical protein [Paraburkholderia sp. RL17-337-BIB-A]|uniref:hypothetical protein n=1 Tax=Paraburkholderia sp. RL17-337-BIB-A TaxID=3031636 RepID=UPI0038B94FA1